MIRKTIHLVRDTTRCDSLTAVLESPSQEIIDAIEPAVLWSLLTQRGLVPELEDETDWGVEKFSSDYDSGKHGDLPVVDLRALDTSAVSSCSANRTDAPSADQAKVPRKHRNTVRHVVRLERSVEQYQVKRVVVKASTVKEVDALDGQEMWWRCPKIEGEGEVDERQVEAEFTVEREPYRAVYHRHLPFVFLQGPMGSDKVQPSREFLLGWQPTSTVTKKNKRESKRVRKLVGSDRNKCYWNARRVMRSLPDYANASYVEGFVVTHDGGIFEHGWIIKDGKTVDSTILDETTYFPGLEFRGRNQIQAFLQTEWGSRFHGRPFHRAFGNFGSESPSFVQAFGKAREYLLSTFGVRAMEAAAAIRAEHGLPWPDDWR